MPAMCREEGTAVCRSSRHPGGDFSEVVGGVPGLVGGDPGLVGGVLELVGGDPELVGGVLELVGGVPAKYPPDDSRVVGGEVEPAGWGMNRATKRSWTEKQARQVLARAEREGAEHGRAGARALNVSAQKIYWWRQRLEANVCNLTRAGVRDRVVSGDSIAVMSGNWIALFHTRFADGAQ
jgi:hypothetical protein